MQEQGDGLTAAAATPKAAAKGLRRRDTERKKAQERFSARYTLALFFGYVKPEAAVGVGRHGAAPRGFKQA